MNLYPTIPTAPEADYEDKYRVSVINNKLQGISKVKR